jgi:uncharacterized membrane protein SirB2
MTLAEYYLQIKQTHVTLVVTSLTLFAARGLGVQLGQRWAMALGTRVASVLIDTVLLGAGATLWWLLQLNPAGNAPWLGAKLTLLLAYIVLGSFALKRARSPAGRRASFAAALLCYAAMAAVAVAHHPLGPLRP